MIDVFMKRQKIVSDKIHEVEEQINTLTMEIHQMQQRKKTENQFIPIIKSMLLEYRETDDIEKKNRLLKSVLEKATFLRQKDWIKMDQFIIELYPLF
ncbi:hypothetical protein [Risungbinella massiliensis]|uniref:hypothetical protein n=1 Tax=Risungbinella massiliensis TaxID=1329796 RepID=UPI0005CC3CF9|nr:hypothetical protein [Risungbinella massiliensis]